MKTILQYNPKNKKGGGYHCSNYLGEVPNTPGGWNLIKKLRNTIGPLFLRGRNPNRKQFAYRGSSHRLDRGLHDKLRSDLSPYLGTTIAIYRRIP